MTRRWLLAWLAPTLAACTNVSSVGTAIAPGAEVFEPRLLGEWVQRSDSVVTCRYIVTQESATLYLIRQLKVDGGESAVYVGRLGPLGARRWILEFSPVADTLKYIHSLFSPDSTRIAPPSLPLMIAVHAHLVIDRADSGFRFAVLNGDSLKAALMSGRLKTPFAVIHDDVLLTETEPSRLNAALQTFADRPGALFLVSRVGHRIDIDLVESH